MKVKEKVEYKNKVLIVDDNSSIRVLLQHLVEEAGYQAVCLSNGEAAYHCLSNSSGDFEIAFVDLEMPVMGGIEVVRKIRSKGIFLPVIAMTAKVLEDSCSNYGMPGFDGLVTKPFTQNVIVHTIKRETERRV